MEFDYRTGDCRELLKTVPDASVRHRQVVW